MTAKEFIEESSDHTEYALQYEGSSIPTSLALKALDMQRKEDTDSFRQFLLKVIMWQSIGKEVDYEEEFRKQFVIK